MKIAAIQMRSGPEPEANLDALAPLIAEAADEGARYVLTPEVTLAFAENREGLSRVAGPYENNPHLARVAQLAREHGVHLHLGSLAVALEDGRFANRSVLFAPDGSVAATYDKIHLFDADIAGLNAYRESATYRGGEAAVTAPVGPFTLGFSICYDMRFPALFNALANAGADLLAVPAAFTVPTGEAHWATLLKARAIENGAFLFAPAQTGTHPSGRRTWGHSMIVGPWGEVLGDAGSAPGILLAEIDMAKVGEVRRNLPSLSHDRAFTLEIGQNS